MVKRGNRIFVGGIIVVAVALVGGVIGLITQRPQHPASETTTSSAVPGGRSATANLQPAPNFPITVYQGEEILGGKQITLARLWETGKPVILNFWAGLCPPCRAELPDFQGLYDEVAKGKWTMIGIDIGPYVGLGSRDEGKALLRELKISFPAGTTFEEDAINVYQILGMPTTVFITSDGRIFKKHAGLLTREQMNTFLQDLLQASGTR
jgi:thiol-disulfide isomerase/thioredoxin